MTNPTEAEIETALWSHLTSIEPVSWTTKLPGVAFKPNAAPWQRGTWMPGTPVAVAFGAGAYHRQRGIYQIDLFYPKSERRVDLLLERAAAMRAHFYPDDARGAVIEAGDGQLIVDQRPAVSGLDESDDAFNRVIVTVAIRIELPPAA